MANICTRMNVALMVFRNGVSKMVKIRAFASFWQAMKQTGITYCWNMAGQYSAGKLAVLDTRKKRNPKRAKGFGFRRIALQCNTVYFEGFTMNDGLEDIGKTAAAILIALCVAMLITAIFI